MHQSKQIEFVACAVSFFLPSNGYKYIYDTINTIDLPSEFEELTRATKSQSIRTFILDLTLWWLLFLQVEIFTKYPG